LRDNKQMLAAMLDEIVEKHVGQEHSHNINTLRRLAKERRAGLPGVEAELVRRIESFTKEEAREAIRALSIYFDLANLAEDRRRIEVLRERGRQARSRPIHESLAEAVAHLKAAGLDAARVQALLDRLSIDMVFTAHPTEAKRRTTRHLLRRMRTILEEFRQRDLLPSEMEDHTDELKSLMMVLWETEMLRPRPPEVLDEVGRGLYFTAGLWEVVPRVLAELRKALWEHYPDDEITVPHFLRFGSWMGGDRDGNPNVTADVTAKVLALMRKETVQRHLAICRDLRWVLVMSARETHPDQRLVDAVAGAGERWPQLRVRLEQISRQEIFRAWMTVIRHRLELTAAASAESAGGAGGYASADELEVDVKLLADSIVAGGGQPIVDTFLAPWLDQIRTFGFHFARLDVRQDSFDHEQAVADMLRLADVCDNYAELDEPGKQKALSQALALPAPWPEQTQGLAAGTREAIALARLLARTVKVQGAGPLGGYVISMTHVVSDLLEVLLLWSWAWRELAGAKAQLPHLPIVPLFETIDDLERAGDVLAALLENETYRRYLRRSPGSEQMIMLGYSDSTKDGGYVAAVWGLNRAMHELADVAARHDVRIVTFHGRGGALGRGGGPTARAIRSLPPVAIGGAIRMTEQGEVLAERYDDPHIAQRHLEQVCWAVMLITGLPDPPPRPQWVKLMNELSDLALAHYRSLIEDAGFLNFFEQATPISEIERLPIGSRPAKRRERQSLADLRAIPWTFAWTQCRQILPAWFGLGTAVSGVVEDSPEGWQPLQEMYREWPFFEALIDNAELALAKADMGIAGQYTLLDDEPGADRLRRTIAAEYGLSRGAVLMITGMHELLGGTPWLQRSIGERNPYVDPLNFLQVELLRRLRRDEGGDESEIAALRDLVRMSIQGVAAGLRTTG
jgi:phosphoenolpyruvate carboxylase